MSISSYNKEYQYHQDNTTTDVDEGNYEQQDDLISYCREYINSHFYGEQSNEHLPSLVASTKSKGTKRKFSLSFNTNNLSKFTDVVTICAETSNPDSLSTLLKLFHLVLTSKSNENEQFMGTEDVIFQHLIVAAALRKRPGEKMNTCFKRLVNDCQRFLHLYNKQSAIKHKVLDTHWGTCQQLRSGKVIADYLSDDDEQPIDPIFGVLLCPYAGQIEPQPFSQPNEDCSNEAESYHRVMYDAFDYLITYHNIGPGSDYLAAFTLFDSDPVSAETTSLLFWERQLNRIKEEGIVIKEKYF